VDHSQKHEVDVDLRIFDLDIIKSVVYRMSARCSIEMAISDQQVVCSFHTKKPIAYDEWQPLAEEFQRQLLDQDLRKRIGKEDILLRERS
jgi:His-Xaa-Ser system protein HxsD